MTRASRSSLPQVLFHFTCVASTKVQILTQKLQTLAKVCPARTGLGLHIAKQLKLVKGTQFTCFTSTKVQVLTQKALLKYTRHGAWAAYNKAARRVARRRAAAGARG